MILAKNMLFKLNVYILLAMIVWCLIGIVFCYFDYRPDWLKIIWGSISIVLPVASGILFNCLTWKRYLNKG